jgi:ketopantoate hydroxymethyltransferase
MARPRPTVADLRARKGQGQLTMLRVFTIDEAAAAEEAGIDIVSIPSELLLHPRYREVAPSLFSMTGRTHLEAGTREDYLRWAGQMMQAGADAVYCSGAWRRWPSWRASTCRWWGTWGSFRAAPPGRAASRPWARLPRRR